MITLTDQEKDLLLLGKTRFEKQITNLRDNKIQSRASFGAILIRQSVDKVSKKTEETFEYMRPKIEVPDLDYETLALIGLITIIDEVPERLSFTGAAVRIGGVIEHEVNARKIREQLKNIKGDKAKIIKKLRTINIKNRYNLSKRDKIRLGTVILSAIESSTGLIEFVKESTGKKVERRIYPSDALLKYIDMFMKENAFMEPVKKPLLSFPIPIDGKSFLGGYAYDVAMKNPRLKQNAKRHLRAFMENGDPGRVAYNINKLQSIPYEVDQEVLNVAWKLYTNDYEVKGMPGKLKKLPQKSLMIADEEERKKARKKYFEIKAVNNSIIGKRIQVARTLMLAKEFAKESHFYFPAFIDFRGRIYYCGDYLNPQGTDMAKALLKFKSKSPIDEDSEFWYYVHGASAYGLDKETYHNRYKWIESHKDLISEIAKNPIKNLESWRHADKPFTFLSFCFDVVRYWADPENHLSGLRLSFDATSSGCQILSLLIRDEAGCINTNLYKSKDGKPNDLYLKCADKLIESINSGECENAEYWRKELKGKNIRSLVKRPLMTTVYSLSYYGLRGYVKDWINDSRGIDGKDYFKKDTYLAREVKCAIDQTVRGVAAGMDWIREVTEALNEENQDLELLIPNGFYMISSYRKPKSKTVKTVLFGNNYYSRYMSDGAGRGELLSNKSINAAVPNTIHALDAALMMRIIENLSAAIPISTVHDAIYFRASEANKVYEAIRRSFVSIFKNDVLKDFRDQIQAMVKAEIKDPPCLGEIDWDEVEEADYAYN